MHQVMHQEAGPEFDELAKRLWDIAEEIIPRVEAVTQLRLPAPTVIRLMTVDDWKKAHETRSIQRLHDETAQFAITLEGKREAEKMHILRLSMRSEFWPLMLGEAVDLDPGHPDLVIVPEALRHAGRLDDDPVLHKLLAHEMTHLAQYTANGGDIWNDQETFFPQQRAVADRNYAFLLEGHAHWADMQITATIFGAPVTIGGISPDASELWRKLASRDVPKEVKAAQARSTDTVTQLIAEQGVDAFNRVWREPTLVPTLAEALEPAPWTERMTAVQ
jgi:hypothetical protein